ncbi:MAG TPA: glutamate--tRNA ligase, partial [Candidatus Hydrogenedentes bacterium]|nr:glutamate--tRNA ligase [Candidatus Hydrogenedentota bacterium]
MSMVRVRIAPAPSGFLHIGTAKTALFNWLFARHTGGTFILRLEDTDAERTDEAYVAAMCAGFKWLGIDWDEGPPFGGEPEKGDYGPYRQSQRRDLYRSAVTRLLDEGKAYKCFCTREELDAEREKARAAKGPLKYSGKCRNLAAADVAAKGDAPYAVRFKVPEGRTEVHDLVQGVVRTDNAEFDDFIIQKPNGDAVFHLAVVVDDGSMGITHVIRGDDHLTNAARHVMLFNALGYDLPQFAHLPMVLDERGKKYSKRDRGANVLDWRDDGYLPEALVNYVALLGWTPAEDREVYARAELIDAFRIDRLGKSAAK